MSDPLDEAAVRALATLDASALYGKPVPPRAWHVDGLIPSGTVTIVNGDGGTGKSLIAKQLGAATILARPWLGRPCVGGRVLYLSAEDDRDEIHRRLVDIARAEDVSLADLDGLVIAPLAGEDAVLAAPDGRNGLIKETPLWRGLRFQAVTLEPALIILDNSADVFGGDENNRAQVRQFVGMLRGLAIETGAAIVLLSHPSVAGMASGSGTSGSTAWSNSVRSRLYLKRVTTNEGGSILEPDPDLRTLSTMKANYGRTGETIPLRWRDGVFVAEETATPSTLDRMTQAARAERVFLDLVDAYSAEGRAVSPSPSASYAPTQFARDPRAQGIPKGALIAAMNALFAAGTLATAETGPPSKRRQRIVRNTNPEAN
ncbi:AAA family ATPase [Salinarimonas rosea]|uniref:AAA family ATPase n=1 Tax=Salinarimonas rosea TaxID=552063 RepID=UPI0003FF3CDA|nr:AAA family ATPase [Salinarimonas rosea]